MGHSIQSRTLRVFLAELNPYVPLHRIDFLVPGGGEGLFSHASMHRAFVTRRAWHGYEGSGGTAAQTREASGGVGASAVSALT